LVARGPAPAAAAGSVGRGRGGARQGSVREAAHPRAGDGGGGLMLAKRLVPCLDVDRSRVVTGVRYVSLRDAGDWLECVAGFDAQAVVLEMDGRRRGGGRGGPESPPRSPRETEFISASADDSWWEVYVHGGRTPTGRDAVAWAREGAERGAGEILLTSMDRDGTKDGFDIGLTRAVADAVPLPVVASGGCGTVEHMTAALTEGRAGAALAASVFHFGEIRIPDAKTRLRAAGVEVRP